MTREQQTITREILAYLVAHPDVEDTVEGIAEWWLLERSIERRLAEVREALSELRAMDFVVVREAGDLRSRYRLNPHRLPQIQALLEAN